MSSKNKKNNFNQVQIITVDRVDRGGVEITNIVFRFEFAFVV